MLYSRANEMTCLISLVVFGYITAWGRTAYGEPSVLCVLRHACEQSMSPVITLERLEKRGGTLEKTLETVIIDTFAIMVEEIQAQHQKNNDTGIEEKFSQKRVQVNASL